MSKMKKLQPEMERIKERFGDDRRAPAAGDDGAVQAREGEPGFGLPADAAPDPGVLLALQGAVRHHRDAARAVLGWIHDLSAPDPTSILNLFGLSALSIRYRLARFRRFLSIGVWPILMGITQWVQTKLNPAPADPVQAKMFAFMPLIFTFMFAHASRRDW